MITKLTVKASTETANSIMAVKLSEAQQVGWEPLTTIQESKQGDKTVLSVWLTPQRKGE